uniref:Uncharacterized protein n=1 Tax=viral metagenome TaxID=1070528 RepID=A0A6C0D8V6_9ZZZZ
MAQSADTLKESTDEYNFYQRMNEIGTYTYNNKMDTIFVFQLTFISLLIFIVLYYLYKNNVITFFVLSSVSLLLGLFVVYVYLNRILVYSKIRDQKDWSRINFGDGTIQPKDYNQAGVDGGENGSVPTQRCGPADPTPVCTAI